MLTFNCPKCGQSLEIDDQHAGRDIQCPACGRYIAVPGQTLAASPPPRIPSEPTQNSGITNQQKLQEVRVVDIKMPFRSMVVFMIKWALAAIPAFIILGLVYAVIMATFLGGCMSLMVP